MQPFELELINKEKVGTDAWKLNFKKPDWFEYQAGQFNEVHLKHPKEDDRGDQRWFTMSSSPTEDVISITTRHVAEHPSSLKNAMFKLKPGDAMQAKGPDGKFVLPKDKSTKIVWVAGGIGVTPFVSQMQYLIDTKDLNRDIVLFYGSRTDADVVCPILLDAVKKTMPNFKLVKVYSEGPPSFVKNNAETGLIDEKLITKYITDMQEREFYVSGPEPMVDSFKQILDFMGVREKHIHQDWFPGYTEQY